ncbi:hypothetical protein [Kocuria sp.]|uniref:hypothetical protein n=1 Tax=Kocuria sp. TaxID=1871328 RepID=UPI0026DFAF4D|nr:hypothetical protein [Kocuria sp.]MDO5619131.1 hypothetical protein [Kocuria sp.]
MTATKNTKQQGAKKQREAKKPKKDRGAARRAKAAARGTSPARGTARTPTQDAANAWRQGISTATAATVDQMTAHMQNVVLEQLEQHGAFPPFAVTAGRDGEYELTSPSPEDIAELDATEVLDVLREQVRTSAPALLGVVLAFPATLPDRSGAAAVIAEVEHVDGVQLTLIQTYRVKGVQGAKRTHLEDAVVEPRESTLLPHPTPLRRDHG